MCVRRVGPAAVIVQLSSRSGALHWYGYVNQSRGAKQPPVTAVKVVATK
jgi:hypothetical protein